MAEGFWLFAICLFLYVLERDPYGVALPISSHQDCPMADCLLLFAWFQAGKSKVLTSLRSVNRGGCFGQTLKIFCHMP